MKPSNTPHISSARELQVQLRLVKQRIRQREGSLEERLGQIPGESIKAVAGAILPVLMGNVLASGLTKLAKSVFELAKGK